MLQQTLNEFLTGGLFALLLVFLRVAGALMTMPGFGQVYVLPQMRLFLSIGLALVMTPFLAPGLPPMPASVADLSVLIVGEILIGVFFGLLARMLITALEVTGMIVSHHIGLANAFLFNPQMAQQGSIIGVFLSTTGVVLLFVTNLHHSLIRGVTESYVIFPPGQLPQTGDMFALMLAAVSASFVIAVQIAAPFFIVGLLLYLGLGILARLMPQVQVFFLALPVQVALGTALLAVCVGAMMLAWLHWFEEVWTGIFTGGF